MEKTTEQKRVTYYTVKLNLTPKKQNAPFESNFYKIKAYRFYFVVLFIFLFFYFDFSSCLFMTWYELKSNN